MHSEIDLVKSDLRNFIYLVWKHLNLSDPTPLQYDICEYIQHGPQRMVVEAFRGVGKSWITAGAVCWFLLNNPQLKIMVVSAGAGKANEISTFIKQLIDSMPILEVLRTVPGKGQRESVIMFDVGPADPDISPSVKSVGITGQITGSRADIIIADDIETPGNSMTQLMRDRLAELVKEFDAVIKPGLKTRIIYLGTPQTEMTLYTVLEARG